MFRTVRHWWSEGSGQHTARLFLFEFVVVVAGVLVAQALANMVANRGLNRQVEEEHARLLFELGRARQTARVWHAAVPCLIQRLDLMVHAAETGNRDLTQDDITQPTRGTYTVENIATDIERPYRDRYGTDEVDLLALAINASAAISDSNKTVRADWNKFGLLTLSERPLSSGEVDMLRSAAVEAQSALRWIDVRYATVERVAERMHVAPIGSGNVLDTPDIPVRSCDEIWAYHDINRVEGR